MKKGTSGGNSYSLPELNSTQHSSSLFDQSACTLVIKSCHSCGHLAKAMTKWISDHTDQMGTPEWFYLFINYFNDASFCQAQFVTGVFVLVYGGSAIVTELSHLLFMGQSHTVWGDATYIFNLIGTEEIHFE